MEKHRIQSLIIEFRYQIIAVALCVCVRDECLYYGDACLLATRLPLTRHFVQIGISCAHWIIVRQIKDKQQLIHQSFTSSYASVMKMYTHSRRAPIVIYARLDDGTDSIVLCITTSIHHTHLHLTVHVPHTRSFDPMVWTDEIATTSGSSPRKNSATLHLLSILFTTLYNVFIVYFRRKMFIWELRNAESEKTTTFYLLSANVCVFWANVHA